MSDSLRRDSDPLIAAAMARQKAKELVPVLTDALAANHELILEKPLDGTEAREDLILELVRKSQMISTLRTALLQGDHIAEVTQINAGLDDE